MPMDKKKKALTAMLDGAEAVEGTVDVAAVSPDDDTTLDPEGLLPEPSTVEKPETMPFEKILEVDAKPIPDPDAMEALKAAVTGIGKLIGGFDSGLDYQRWVVYGNNGTGKTTFLGTIPDVLVINAERGTRSISDVTTGVQVPISKWGDIEDLYWYLQRCTPLPGGGLLVPTEAGVKTVRTIAIDTVTRLIQMCLRSVVLGEREKDISRDIVKATQSDWGTAGQKIIYWLSALKQLPVNTVWVCQERKGDTESESDYMVMPDLPRSVRNFICGDAEIIARTYVKQNSEGIMKYVMHFGTSDTAQTKDRSRRLPGVVANPKWPALVKRINSKED